MSLEAKWQKAKKWYDNELKENAKLHETLQKERKALLKVVEKEHKKQKLKKKVDEYLRDAVLAKMEAPGLIKFLEPVKKKEKEIAEAPRMRQRKTLGAETAFREVDKVLQVGQKLLDAKVEDPKKWAAWRDMAVSSLKKCAKAETKFDNWMKRAEGVAEEEIERKFRNIHSTMKKAGTPILKHAQQVIAAGDAAA